MVTPNIKFKHQKHFCALEILRLRKMSAARNSSYKLNGLVTLLYRYRASSSPSPSQSYLRDHFFSSKLGYGGYMNQGLRFISGSTREADNRKPDFDMAKDIQRPVPPVGPVPPSPKAGISAWVKWLLSSMLLILLPFCEQKWKRLLELEGEVEKLVGEVGQVAEVVEKVATVTEKVSADVAEQLPDNTVIKEAALAVEHISSVTATDAHLTEDFIHKVEDVKQDLKDLGTMVEPVIDNIIKVAAEPQKK